ncbi:MAG: DUF2851 family protein [Bacteroidota bacterium]
MQESFLSFVWQFQYFDKRELITTSGDKIDILSPGILNTDAGPDFENAKVNIQGIDWAGHIEIHTLSSHWKNHKHEDNPAYNSVILHVVWENNVEVKRPDGTTMPTLVLNGLVDLELINNYQNLIKAKSEIPCENSIDAVSSITQLSMIERVAVERMKSKADDVIEILGGNQYDWNQAAYQLLLKNFGFKINGEAFLALSKALPYKVLAKHLNDPVAVQALLFGQAGFLDQELDDSYFNALKREYNFLSYKYGIYDARLTPEWWKMLRLRPANFPTIRIAQLAKALYGHQHLFTFFLEVDSVEQLYKHFRKPLPDYWNDHYLFGKSGALGSRTMGKQSVRNILINTVVPLLVAYAKEKDEPSYLDKASTLLQDIQAEDNKITRKWASLEIKAKNAFESQGQIALMNNYCKKRKCLSCAIGSSILKHNAL